MQLTLLLSRLFLEFEAERQAVWAPDEAWATKGRRAPRPFPKEIGG